MLRTAVVVCVIVFSWGFPGCRSDDKKKEQGSVEAPRSSPPAQTTAPVVSAPVSPPEQPVPEPAPPPPRVPEGRFVEGVRSLPASFWGLPIKEHVVMRAKTLRLFEVPQNIQNPIELTSVLLVGLDLDKGGEEFFDEVVQRLYEHLFEQKVFTAAIPVTIFWNPFQATQKPQWSVAVPIGAPVEVKPPLRLIQMPSARVHAVRIPLKEAIQWAESDTQKHDGLPLYDNARRAIVNGRKTIALTLDPRIVVLRFPDIAKSPIGPESTLEVLFYEKNAAPTDGKPKPSVPPSR